jgi:hypothetical protein
MVGVYLTFDVKGKELPGIGKNLEMVRIDNDPNVMWFPHKDNHVNYGRVVEITLTGNEDGYRTATIVTRVSKKHYYHLSRNESFGISAIRRASGFEEEKEAA